MISFVGLSLADEDIRYHSAGKRDPFVSLASSSDVGGKLLSVQSLDEIVVEGIVYDPLHGSMVMANGAFLKEGEQSGSVKLVRVNSGSAVFLVNGMEGTKILYRPEDVSGEAH